MGIYDDIIGGYDIIGARGGFPLVFGAEFGDAQAAPVATDYGMVATPQAYVPSPAAPQTYLPSPYGGGGGCGPYGCGPNGIMSNNSGANNLNNFASLVAAKNSLGVVGRCPAKARIEMLGFPRTTIAAGATVTVTTQPQVLSKIFRIVIPSDIAFQLLVHEFKVGKWNLFANGDPCPAAMLDELASDIGELNPDTAQVNSQVSITVENTSNADVDFRAGCFVKAIE
jgi:hypothetical protein